MKRPHAFFYCLFLSSCYPGEAQSTQKNQFDINLGTGIDNTFLHDPGRTEMMPASANVGYFISDVINLGGYYFGSEAITDYIRSPNPPIPNFGYPPTQHYRERHIWTFNIAGIRGVFHFTHLIPARHVDFYAGLMPGYLFSKEIITSDYVPNAPNAPDPNGHYGGFLCAGFLGCRYNLTDHAGLYLEAGYGITFINLGINAHL